MKYIKMPFPVEAFLWNGTSVLPSYIPNGTIHDVYEMLDGERAGIIETSEGPVNIRALQHYIVGPGVRGEFWPVHKDIFEETYAAAPIVGDAA